MKNKTLIFMAFISMTFHHQLSAQALHWLSKPVIDVGVVPNGSVGDAQISASGRFIAFTSSASNLIPNDSNHTTDLFLYDTLNQTIERINQVSFNNTFSVQSFTKPTSDGSKIAFISRDEQIGNISNPNRDEYFYTLDLINNQVTLESIDLNNIPFEADPFNDTLVMTDDGLSLFFSSDTLLDPLHTGFATQTYRKDLNNGSYELIGVTTDGTEIASSSVFFDNASADGRFITLKTSANNLVTEPLIGTQLLRKDLSDNTYELVTKTPSGTSPSGSSISTNATETSVANNGHIAFISFNDELVTGDTNNGEDVFYYNGTSNVRVTLDENGNEVNLFFVDDVHISGDSTQLTFSTGTDLINSQNDFFVFDVFLYDTNSQILSNVSTNDLGLGANDSSTPMGFSADSDQLIFTSSATDITGAPNNIKTNLYSHNHNTNELTLLNNAISASNASLSAGFRPKISKDQRYVAFMSRTNTLVPYEPGSLTHKRDNLLLQDRETDVFSLIAHRVGFDPHAMSPSGQYIAFPSRYFPPEGQIDLGSTQIFIYDRINDSYHQVASGRNPSINDAGLLVFSTSEALSNTDTNNETDVYLYDLGANAFSLISTNLSGQAATGNSGSPDISNTPNETQIVFSSNADDLTASDINGLFDVFLTSWPNGNITRISQTTAGTGGNDDTFSPSISDDGMAISFVSQAQNLSNNDYSNASDSQIFLYDTITESIQLITQDDNGLPMPSSVTVSPFEKPSLSNSGRYVSYQALGTSPLGGDNDATNDVFLFDAFTGQTSVISQQLNGSQVSDVSTSIIASDVVEDTSVSPPLLGVAFNGSHELTGINNHPGLSEVFLYQSGGPIEGSGTGVVNGSQGISWISQCDSNYPLGTDLILIAAADSGSIFYGWQSSREQCVDDSNPCNLTMDRDKELRAVFL